MNILIFIIGFICGAIFGYRHEIKFSIARIDAKVSELEKEIEKYKSTGGNNDN